MTQKVSNGTDPRGSDKDRTESLIQNAMVSSTQNRIALNHMLLDDENLPESERMSVLDEIFHRNIRHRQIERLARQLAPLLAGSPPPNLLIYGPSGTGKSVTCLHFLSTLARVGASKGVPFQFYCVDFTTPKTCFGAFNELAIALDSRIRRYRKGIALQQIQEMIIQALSSLQGITCILVDEVDNVTNDSDIFFTFLAKTLPRKVPVRLFYLFLTNRLEWDKTIDPRVLSVLKKTDMIFEPYDAMNLVEILKLRVEKALDAKKVDPAAIRKIAGYASRETGDARKAVELLVKAVKVAEETTGFLGESQVDQADRMLEIDKTEELIQSLAVQQRLALKACHEGLSGPRKHLSTGHAYQCYEQVCQREGNRPLTQRRFSDMVSFLDIYGLINARVTSRGRYGKTRELSQALPRQIVTKLFRGQYG